MGNNKIINTLIRVLDIFIPVSFLSGLYKELSYKWFLYETTSKIENEKELQKYNYRIDWIGRPWKILRIPTDFMDRDMNIPVYITEQLKKETLPFLKMGIGDMIVPDIQQVKNKINGKTMYAKDLWMITMHIPCYYSTWKSFILNFLWYGILYTLIFYILNHFTII